MDDKDLIWEEISTEHIVQDEWIDFRRSAYRFPDGSEFGPFYNYSRRDYTVIVASDEDGNYLCVRQYRQGIKQVTTEFPAGGIERSDGKEYGDRASAEAALDCAKRELLEETGYTSDDWTHLITVPSNATIADNYACVYMARNCRKVDSQHLDETEHLNVVKHTADEIETLIRTGGFQQAIHVMAWMMAKERRNPQAEAERCLRKNVGTDMKNEQKTNSIMALGFVIMNLVIQIIGFINYEMLPNFFWSLSDCIIIMTPLLFGFSFGLICMIPMAAAELIWYAKLLSIGPLLHIVSFFLSVCICAVLFRLIIDLKPVKRALLTGIIFETGLLAESLLYYCLRYLFLPSHQAVTWEAVSGPFLSLANPLMLIVAFVFIVMTSGDSASD